MLERIIFKFRNQESLAEPVVYYNDQNYEDLKDLHNQNELFEDPMFPTDSASLYGPDKSFPDDIVWLRPKEVMENPEFVVDGFGRSDMDQGSIGNCWFIAACVGIMQNRKLFARVVPRNQSFTENYSGMFHFQFWLYGQWVSVVVDDRLPFFATEKKLVFCSNKEQPNEFWGSLLEKAYAKVYGSYENLESGQTYDALIDMSGGIQESIELQNMTRKERNQLWSTLFTSFKRKSMIACSINPDPEIKEAHLENGLIKGHAFTITSLATVELDDNTEKLLRIRNPWGNEVEWNGSWSDNSSEWDLLSETSRDKLGHLNANDGEFWMNFSDFMSNFDVVQIVHINLDCYIDNALNEDDYEENKWNCTYYHSIWSTEHDTAGGCGKINKRSFWKNPQFLISLKDPDLNDDDDEASLLIALMQKDTRLKRLDRDMSSEEYIQYRLYKIKDDVEIDENKLTHLKLTPDQLVRVGSSGSYINSREVTKRFKLVPGYYVIVPSTYEEDRDVEFMLRIFTENPIETDNLDEAKELDNMDSDELGRDEDFLFKNWCDLLNDKLKNEFSDQDFFRNKTDNDINNKECNLM